MKETRAKQGKPVGNPCAPSFGVQSRNFGCRWRSSEGNPRETGETRRVRTSKVAWGNPCEIRGTRWEPCATLYASFGVETRNFETLDVAGEARRETRAKQAKPVGFEPPRSLGETRAKQGGPVGNLVQRCTPALALRQETSKKSGPPRDAEEAVGRRKPGCRNRVQNFAETHETLGPCSEPRLWPSWGASPLGERRCV